MNIQRIVWCVEGLLYYGFKDYVALDQVSANFKRIGAVPAGYMYPELVLAQHMPDSLRETFERKEKHVARAGAHQ